ncbi:MAG: ABC transporter ATP-binding protein [Candidatus Omnitrophota bacterium]
MTPLLRINNLHKTYTTGRDITTPALRGVTLDIFSGDFLAIAGPSGSGKSSLLNIIGALDNPTAGTVHFADRDISSLSPDQLSDFRLRSLGFIFQAYNLINTLTARENVEYVMLLQGLAPEERTRRAQDTLSRVGLADYLDRFPNEMSGGQQQRVAVARAIVAEPRLIIADEPTANLDSATSESLIELMKELNADKEVTFVFSTHDPLVMDKARRLVHIRDGMILDQTKE